MFRDLQSFRTEVSDRFGIGAIACKSPTLTSSLRAWQLPACAMIEVAADAPLVIAREQSHITHSPREFFTVALMLEGQATLYQSGRNAELNANDLVLCDSRVPFEIEFKSEFRQILLNIPCQRLESRLLHPEEVTARAVAGRIGLPSIASSVLLTASRQASALGEHASLIEDHIVEMTTAVFGERRQLVDDPGAAALRLARRFIETNLTDPKLSPSSTARALKYSRRRLYKLFEATGEGVAQYIRRRRLETAKSMLAAAPQRRQTISEIAYAVGFSDPTQFSRAFRKTFGIPPSDYQASIISKPI